MWQELNNTFSERLRDAFSVDSEVDDAAFISIDSQGVDVRVRQGAQASSVAVLFDAKLNLLKPVSRVSFSYLE